MAIIPETLYPGKTTAGSASYPYGGAQNVTAPGDGTGTPWEASLLNDIFGEQQALLSEAGITPSGSPETALISQYKEAIRTITNMRLTTYNMAADANYTLTTDQNNKRFVVITDTGVLLSTGRDIIVDNVQKRFIAKNETLQILTFKTAAGTGIAVAAGKTIDLYNDGTDVINATSLIVASTAEAQAGTDDAKYISPLKLREGLNAAGLAPIYANRAWVKFNGTGTVAINGSGNVSSITDNAVGDYTVNFITPMADTNYSCLGGNSFASIDSSVYNLKIRTALVMLVGSVRLLSIAAAAATSNVVDCDSALVIITK